MDPFITLQSNQTRNAILREIAQLGRLITGNDANATQARIEELENRIQGVAAPVRAVRDFEFIVPRDTLDEILTTDGYTRPINRLHYKVISGKNYYNANQACFDTADPDRTAYEARAAMLANNPLANEQQLHAEFIRARNERIDANNAAAAAPPRWVLCQRTEENLTNMEDMQVRYTDKSKTKIDWNTTIRNIHRIGQQYGYTLDHYANCMTRFVSFFEPELLSLIDGMETNQMARYLMARNTPIPEKKKHFIELKKMSRKVGQELRSIMNDLETRAEGYYRDEPDATRADTILKLKLQGLQAFTSGRTHDMLKATIQQRLLENEPIEYDTLLETAILSEEIAGQPTVALPLTKSSQASAITTVPTFHSQLLNVDPLVQGPRSLVRPLVQTRLVHQPRNYENTEDEDQTFYNMLHSQAATRPLHVPQPGPIHNQAPHLPPPPPRYEDLDLHRIQATEQQQMIIEQQIQQELAEEQAYQQELLQQQQADFHLQDQQEEPLLGAVGGAGPNFLQLQAIDPITPVQKFQREEYALRSTQAREASKALPAIASKEKKKASTKLFNIQATPGNEISQHILEQAKTQTKMLETITQLSNNLREIQLNAAIVQQQQGYPNNRAGQQSTNRPSREPTPPRQNYNGAYVQPQQNYQGNQYGSGSNQAQRNYQNNGRQNSPSRPPYNKSYNNQGNAYNRPMTPPGYRPNNSQYRPNSPSTYYGNRPNSPAANYRNRPNSPSANDQYRGRQQNRDGNDRARSPGYQNRSMDQRGQYNRPNSPGNMRPNSPNPYQPNSSRQYRDQSPRPNYTNQYKSRTPSPNQRNGQPYNAQKMNEGNMILGVNCHPNYTKAQGLICTKCQTFGKHTEYMCPYFYNWSPTKCSTCKSGMHLPIQCNAREATPDRNSPNPFKKN